MSETLPLAVAALVARGALFVVNHSAGKDSQAMLIHLRRHVPDAQLLLIHADLGRVEWDGNVDHIRATSAGLPLLIAHSRRDLLQMVRDRFANKPDVPSWPSPSNRQCTSDLKRGPIEREIRRHLKAHPEFGGLIVNCMGMRAQESASRSKLTTFKLNEGNSKAGREWYDWLPIHALSTDDVFAMIRDAGQDAHPIYAQGMSRLSCRFCIMASEADLTIAARLSPDLYREYCEIEETTGYSMSMSGKRLPEITGIDPNESQAPKPAPVPASPAPEVEPVRAASPILQRLAEANAELNAIPMQDAVTGRNGSWDRAFDKREALQAMAVSADPIAYVRAYPSHAMAHRHLLPSDMVARIEAAETDAEMIAAVAQPEAPRMVPQVAQQQQARAGAPKPARGERRYVTVRDCETGEVHRVLTSVARVGVAVVIFTPSNRHREGALNGMLITHDDIRKAWVFNDAAEAQRLLSNNRAPGERVIRAELVADPAPAMVPQPCQQQQGMAPGMAAMEWAPELLEALQGVLPYAESRLEDMEAACEAAGGYIDEETDKARKALEAARQVIEHATR